MKLIGIPTSSPVRKVRIFLEEKGVAYEMEFVDTFPDPNPLQQLNPLGKVPVLTLDSGEVLFDSYVIVEYLEDKYPDPCLVPQKFAERLLVRQWEALADGAIDSIRAIVYECDWKEPEHRSNTWIRRHCRKIERSLASLSSQLGNNEWCVLNRFTLADVIVGCLVGSVSARLAALRCDRAFPNLWQLYGRLELRESFRRTAIPDRQVKLPRDTYIVA